MHPLTWLLILFSFSYGNISRMAHELAHGNADFSQYRDVAYAYDQLDRLTKADDAEQDYFDEAFEYDAQGRMIAQRRDTSVAKNAGGEYAYYANTNRLKSIANGMGGTADDRNMSDANNFVYDSEGNLIEDKSKKMRITYDWRGMPMEFVRRAGNGDSLKLVMTYDGSGRRISKTILRKIENSDNWTLEQMTHYTGIGSEIRKEYHNGELQSTKVVVNMPNGLGRYGIENADGMAKGDEFYLKNHLGSTMMVAQVSSTNASEPAEITAAYDYRAFGEQVTLKKSVDKVTENFTGKERDDETELNYFGARYLDPMLGMWTSVDPSRQFASPYLYVGNGYNPVNGVDPDGNVVHVQKDGNNLNYTMYVKFEGDVSEKNVNTFINSVESFYTRKVGNFNITMNVVNDPDLAENTIEFVNKIGRSYAYTYPDRQEPNVVNSNCAKVFMLNGGNGARSSIHESGHLMGMKDRYVEYGDGSWEVQDHFTGNIMGDKGNGLFPAQIDETLNKKSNTYENFDPWNDR